MKSKKSVLSRLQRFYAVHPPISRIYKTRWVGGQWSLQETREALNDGKWFRQMQKVLLRVEKYDCDLAKEFFTTEK